jgi:crotonobetainyl-CoA:carnitine CoA-transferase CaiB-like acyl-CoA transferase
VEISLFDALSEWMGYPLYFTAYGGTPPTRFGAAHPAIAPYGPFAAADGEVVIAIQNEREWASFCAGVLEAPELAGDPRFASNSLRVANRDELLATLHTALGALSVAELTRRLDAARIANGRMNDVAGLLAHPQLSGRDRWRQIDSPVGELTALLPPIEFPGLQLRMDAVPEVGEHTDAILRGLGRSDADLAELRAAGVV